MKKGLPFGVKNPFSDAFLEWWDKWKVYKKTVHGFEYKGVMSEEIKIMQLHELAKGDETVAVEIIKKSIGEQWKGLFAIPETNKQNGRSNNPEKLGTSAARIKKAGEW